MRKRVSENAGERHRLAQRGYRLVDKRKIRRARRNGLTQVLKYRTCGLRLAELGRAHK